MEIECKPQSGRGIDKKMNEFFCQLQIMFMVISEMNGYFFDTCQKKMPLIHI